MRRNGLWNRMASSAAGLVLLLGGAVPALTLQGSSAWAHHIGNYRGRCLGLKCTRRGFLGICTGRGCARWHYNHAAHNAVHAKWAAEKAACEKSRKNAVAEAAKQASIARKRAEEAKGLISITRNAVIGDLEAAKKAARGAEAADNAAQAAQKTAAAQAGKQCADKSKKEIATSIAAAKASAKDADKHAAEAVAAFRAAENAHKVGKALDKYLENLRGASLELMAAAREMGKRAPRALEAVGGFTGAGKDRFLRAVAVIRYRTAQTYRLLRVARALQTAAFTPKDDKGVTHLVALQNAKEFDQAEDFMEAPVDSEKEVDKELDNFSLRQLGVGGEGKNPERDTSNLEFPFDRAKAALSKILINGKRYLRATTDTFLDTHVKQAKTVRIWFDRAAAEIKRGLKAVILAITSIQAKQAGE